MNFYEELRAEFSTAAQHFRTGNYLLFFRDMTHKLSDLLFTKGEQCSDNNCVSENCLWEELVLSSKITPPLQ